MGIKRSIVAKTGRGGMREGIVPFLFLLPFFVSYLMFFLFPACYSFVLSFFRYKGYGKAVFVGLDNYVRLFTYSTMWTSLGNTFFYFFTHFIPVMILSFLLALAVRSTAVAKSSRFYKMVIFLPQMCAVVASSLVFKVIFGGEVGVINQLFGTKIFFLNDLDLLRWPVTSLIIWRSTGWFFVIYLSGLTTISDEIMDASLIDGANFFQRTFRITIPMMKSIFMFAFIMDAISSLKLYTEPVLLTGDMSGIPPAQSAPFVDVIVNNLQGGSFGMASASGWILFMIIFMITLLQFGAFKRGEER